MGNLVPREIAGSIALSIREACQLSSLGRTKFYELMSRNVIPAYKVGRRRLVLRDELQQALKSLPRAGGRS
jgi:excisionase family DNA binding protein